MHFFVEVAKVSVFSSSSTGANMRFHRRRCCGLFSVMLASLVAVATPGRAQDAGTSTEAKTTLKPGDADGDGKITRVEWNKMAQMRVKLDKNGDDDLDVDELKAAADDGGAVPFILKSADANNDGKVNRAEWSRMILSFVRWDADKDGALTSAELQYNASAPTVTKNSGTGTTKTATTPPSGPQVWRGWIVNGRGDNPNDGMIELELTINGNEIVGRELSRAPGAPGGGGGGGSLGSGTFQMTGDGKSGNIDAVYTGGPRQGEQCLGIFQMEGDLLRWCVNNRGARPQDFGTGGGNWLMLLRRQPAAQ